jgi:hypothetical protein
MRIRLANKRGSRGTSCTIRSWCRTVPTTDFERCQPAKGSHLLQSVARQLDQATLDRPRDG